MKTNQDRHVNVRDNWRLGFQMALVLITVFLSGVFCSCSHKKESQAVWPPALGDALAQLQELQSHSANPASPEIAERVKHLEAVVESEVRTHRAEIFRQQLSALRAKRVDARLVRLLGSTQPVFASKVDGDLFGAGGGTFELFNMMPLTLTPYLTSFIDRDVLSAVGHEKGDLKVLSVSDHSCRTAIEYSRYVVVADFCANGFKWRPEAVMLFKKP